MKRALLPTAALAAFLYLAPAQAQTYKLVDTGHVGNNETASGTAQSISPTGEIGGQSSPTFNYGYRWQNGAITQLDDVKNASGYTYVNGINSAGVAVGSCADYFTPDDRFVRWNGTAATDLGSVGDGQGDGQAFAINDNGLIVGTSFDAYYGYEHAVTYDTAFHLLPYLAGAPTTAYAEAHAVNLSGEAAGWCDGANNTRHAVLWKGGKAYDLGLFGGTRSEADGMNDAGQVVGWYQTAPDANGNTQDRAFLWTPATANGTTGTMQDIGVLPGGTSAYAYDINNNGQVVGYSFSASAAGYAFLWDAAHGMQDLTKLVKSISTEIQPNNGNFYLTNAHAINDKGQIAADFTLFITDGSTDHVDHGCLLDPGAGTVTKPAAPGNLKVVGGAQIVAGPLASATGKISLTWMDNSSNETSFVLQRRTGTGAFATLATLAANATSYADGTVTVGASYGYRVKAVNSAGSSAYSNTATATASAPAAVTLSSLTLTPTSVTGGNTSTGKVTLSAVAPAGGATVTLKSSDTASAAVPASVTVAAGNKSISFTVTSRTVTSTKTVIVTATAGTSSKTATLTVTPASATVTAKSLTATPSSVSSDGQTLCTLTLSGAAPAGGASVPISANGTQFYTATVAAGATSASFNVNWGVVSSTTTNTLSAAYGGKTVSTTVTVSPTAVTLKSYSFSPNPITGGQTATAKVTLSAAAPSGGAVITINYNGAYFYQFVIAAGQTTGSYSQATNTVTASTSYPFTAKYNGASLSKTLTVAP